MSQAPDNSHSHGTVIAKMQSVSSQTQQNTIKEISTNADKTTKAIPNQTPNKRFSSCSIRFASS